VSKRTPENGYHGAECRGCGKALRGYPYHMGKPAYLPLDEGGGQAKSNHYGGFVCSYQCDYNSALRLEQTMPGHMEQAHLSPPLSTEIRRRWEAQS
jgi:hypothetical protein